MRGDQPVHSRETCEQRNPDFHKRNARAPCDNEYQGDQQYESDFEEQGNAYEECSQHHGPVDFFLPE
ncbi:hypothetical protein D3C80_2105890 [compost metagenome]